GYSPFREIDSYIKMGSIYAERAELTEALKSFNQALDLSRPGDYSEGEWRALLGVARCHFKLGCKETSLTLLLKAAEILKSISSAPLIGEDQTLRMKERESLFEMIRDLEKDYVLSCKKRVKEQLFNEEMEVLDILVEQGENRLAQDVAESLSKQFPDNKALAEKLLNVK
ncbi:MAG: tetratricopeptide repeat protein, partial [Blastocatellia bacterium]|nr:tetratricopeptide repeat protein [Blastocatellia bacterium]